MPLVRIEIRRGRSPEEKRALLDAVHAAIREALATPAWDRNQRLCYHPRNVLTDGRRLTAVLDWTNARLGDPRADVARTFTILRLHPRPPAPAAPLAALEALIMHALLAGWQRGYRQVAGDLPPAPGGRRDAHDRPTRAAPA